MIRNMTLDDLDQVMEIEKEAFHEHWKRKDFEYEVMENEFSTLKVYEENGKILGMIGYYILFDDAQVTTLAVLKEAQGKKIGSMLMEHMLKACTQKKCAVVSLEVRQSNIKAINLYKKFDFIEMNIRKSYYEDGEDALFMMRALGGNDEQDFSD